MAVDAVKSPEGHNRSQRTKEHSTIIASTPVLASGIDLTEVGVVARCQCARL